MLKELELFIVLVCLLIAILLIFNARIVVRRKMGRSNENIKVIIVKIFGVVLAIVSFFCLFWFYVLFVNATRSNSNLQSGFSVLP